MPISSTNWRFQLSHNVYFNSHISVNCRSIVLSVSVSMSVLRNDLLACQMSNYRYLSLYISFECLWVYWKCVDRAKKISPPHQLKVKLLTGADQEISKFVPQFWHILHLRSERVQCHHIITFGIVLFRHRGKLWISYDDIIIDSSEWMMINVAMVSGHWSS